MVRQKRTNSTVSLYALINLIGPLQLAIQVVQKDKKKKQQQQQQNLMLESKNRTGRRKTKGITISNDVNI